MSKQAEDINYQYQEWSQIWSQDKSIMKNLMLINFTTQTEWTNSLEDPYYRSSTKNNPVSIKDDDFKVKSLPETKLHAQMISLVSAINL